MINNLMVGVTFNVSGEKLWFAALYCFYLTLHLYLTAICTEEPSLCGYTTGPSVSTLLPSLMALTAVIISLTDRIIFTQTVISEPCRHLEDDSKSCTARFWKKQVGKASANASLSLLNHILMHSSVHVLLPFFVRQIALLKIMSFIFYLTGS